MSNSPQTAAYVVQPPAPVVVNLSAPQATRGPNHVLHAILTLLTGGLWLPVWLVIALRNKRRPA